MFLNGIVRAWTQFSDEGLPYCNVIKDFKNIKFKIIIHLCVLRVMYTGVTGLLPNPIQKKTRLHLCIQTAECISVQNAEILEVKW